MKKIRTLVVASLAALLIDCSSANQEKQETPASNVYIREKTDSSAQRIPPLESIPYFDHPSLEELSLRYPVRVNYSRADSQRVVLDELVARLDVYVRVVRTKQDKIAVQDVVIKPDYFIYLDKKRVERITYDSVDESSYDRSALEYFRRNYSSMLSTIEHSFRDRTYAVPKDIPYKVNKYFVKIDYNDYKRRHNR